MTSIMYEIFKENFSKRSSFQNKVTHLHVGELRVVCGDREDDVFDVEVLVHDLQAREGDVDQVTRVHENSLKQFVGLNPFYNSFYVIFSETHPFTASTIKMLEVSKNVMKYSRM